MPRKDLNQTAFAIVQQAVEDLAKDDVPAQDGRVRSGLARAKSLSPEQRKAIATDAAKARWKSKQPSGVVSCQTQALPPQKRKIVP